MVPFFVVRHSLLRNVPQRLVWAPLGEGDAEHADDIAVSGLHIHMGLEPFCCLEFPGRPFCGHSSSMLVGWHMVLRRRPGEL